MNERPPVNFRTVLRDWIRAELQRRRKKGLTEHKVPEIARKTLRHFMRDATFKKQIVQYFLPNLIYEECLLVVAASRDVAVLPSVSELLNGKPGQKLKAPFFEWVEHVGNHHMYVADMRRDDLLLAAKERRRRSQAEARIAKLWETLAARLKGRQKVSDVFTPEEVEKLY